MRKLLLSLLACGCASTQAAQIDLGPLESFRTYSIGNDDIPGIFHDTLTFSIDADVKRFYIKYFQLNNTDFQLSSFDNANASFVGSQTVNYPGFPQSFSYDIYGQGGTFLNIGNGRYNYVSGQYLIQVSTVPEPSTWLILLAGAGFMAIYRKRLLKSDQN